jgi:predicted transcriptional regulator
MKRTTVFLDERVEGDLRAVARRRKEPVAATIREALERFVASEGRERGSIRFLAVGRSGRRDTARRHEDILWKGLEPHGSQQLRAGRPRRRKG